MQISEDLIRSVVTQVLTEVRGGAGKVSHPTAEHTHFGPGTKGTSQHGPSAARSSAERFGQFTCAHRAVAAGGMPSSS